MPLFWAVTICIAAVFAADHYTPYGVAIYMLYLIPSALAFFFWQPKAPLYVATISTALIILAYYTTPEGPGRELSEYRRGFAVLTVLVLAGIGFRFIRIRLEARKKSWIDSGQAALSEHLLGKETLGEVADRTLDFLCGYLNAQAGAMFVDVNGLFKRVGTFGAAAGSTPESFTPEDGLLGRAVKDNRIFTLSGIPDGYLKVGSAMGQAVPRHLAVIPMTAEGKVTAVVELGFFNEIHSEELQMIDRIASVVGTTVRSVDYRMKVQALLEETQRQSEEVQAQSEELRVSNEELEEQTRALKESQTRLELQQTEMEQINSQLEEQTQILERQKTDLMDAKVALELQAQEVEQASRYKSDFLANMSHELRTPLNSSLILAKLLSENRNGNLTAEQVKYAKTIESAGNDLLTLINDVLDLSKIEAGHMEIAAVTVNLHRTAQTMRDVFEPLAADKGLRYTIEVDPQLPETIETDPVRLEQILKNLLSNAVKFTEKGEVKLKITRGPRNLISFRVSDTGIGITQESRKAIFDPFYQAETGTSRKFGGTGLGLSISRNLARLLGGEIRVTSDAGKGSEFTLLIPEIWEASIPPQTKAPVLAEARPDTDAIDPMDDGESLLGDEISGNEIGDDRDRLTGKGRVILVVEDDKAFAEIIYQLAKEMNFECLVATTSSEALRLARKYLPSAIVLDVGLPDNSGLVVLERLKASPDTRHIPVHVVSAADYSHTALSMGAVGYMLKPVKREQLIEAFKKLENKFTQSLRRVLLVEDDPIQMEALRDLLGSRDVEAVGVRTAAECLEQLAQSTFDCMVLDLSLPDASGFALLERLSKEHVYAFPPVIVYTGRVLSSEEEQRLRKYSKSIIIKGAKSTERLLDEVTLFLHQVVSELPRETRKLIEKAINRDEVLEGRTILIAEDDVRNVFALTSVFEGRNVKLKVARNGREAVKELEKSAADPEERIDLVLMDVMMPEMDGLTAMREIRKRSEWRKLPIIALTAKAMKSDQEQCLAAGANDYLAKPLDVEKLLSLVRVWMPR